MNILVLLILALISSDSLALFLDMERSNCYSDRQCPDVRRYEQIGTTTFLGIFPIGQWGTRTISRGRCINYNNGPLCNLFGGVKV